MVSLSEDWPEAGRLWGRDIRLGAEMEVAIHMELRQFSIKEQFAPFVEFAKRLNCVAFVYRRKSQAQRRWEDGAFPKCRDHVGNSIASPEAQTRVRMCEVAAVKARNSENELFSIMA